MNQKIHTMGIGIDGRILLKSWGFPSTVCKMASETSEASVAILEVIQHARVSMHQTCKKRNDQKSKKKGRGGNRKKGQQDGKTEGTEKGGRDRAGMETEE